jgi:hypothetical protein
VQIRRHKRERASEYSYAAHDDTVPEHRHTCIPIEGDGA